MNKGLKKIQAIMPIAIAISCLGVSFAWFFINTNVNFSSSNNFEVQVGNDIKIARLLEDNTWSDFGNSLVFNADTKLSDCSGDGSTFCYPSSVNKRTNEAEWPMWTIEEGENEGWYCDFSFKVQCNFTTSLYLANGSYVKPLSSSGVDVADATSRISINRYSADYIAGAVRVALLEDVFDSSDATMAVTSQRLVQVWIPNDKYETTFYQGLPAEFVLNGIREESYGYQRNHPTLSEIQTFTYTADDYIKNRVAVGNNALADNTTQMSNHALPIISFTNDGTDQIKRFTLRVWIEGTDREANDTTNMGKIAYFFNFITMNKVDTEPTASSSLNSINILNSDVTDSDTGTTHREYFLCKGTPDLENYCTSTDNLEYSFNGIDWTKYTGAKLVFPVKRTHNRDGNGDLILNSYTSVTEFKDTVYIKHSEEVSQIRTAYITRTLEEYVPEPEEE